MKLLMIGLLLLCTGCTNSTSSVNSITDDIPELSIPKQELQSQDYESFSNQKIAWGIGAETNEKKQPLDSIKASEQYSHYDAMFLHPHDGEILLTFDNGYENGNTPSILDTLKKHDVRAVFFVTSQYAVENPKLIDRMIEEGHVIGNHSWHHKSFPELSIEELTEEIMSLHNYMIEHHHYCMNVLRPPMGEFSERSLAAIQDLGYTTMMWSYAYYDYDVSRQPDHAEALDKLISHLHSNEILLLHAISTTNMEILDEFIDQTLNKGYQFAEPA